MAPIITVKSMWTETIALFMKKQIKNEALYRGSFIVFSREKEYRSNTVSRLLMIDVYSLTARPPPLASVAKVRRNGNVESLREPRAQRIRSRGGAAAACRGVLVQVLAYGGTHTHEGSVAAWKITSFDATLIHTILCSFVN